MAGGWTTPAPVAAVSEAGGLGTHAAARLTATQLRQQLQETRSPDPPAVRHQSPARSRDSARGRRARGAQVLAEIRRRLGLPAYAASRCVAQRRLAMRRGTVPVISFALGSPAPWSSRCAVFAAATTVAEAVDRRRGARPTVAQAPRRAGIARHSRPADPSRPSSCTGPGGRQLPVVAAAGSGRTRHRGGAGARRRGRAARHSLPAAAEAGTPPSYRRSCLPRTRPVPWSPTCSAAGRRAGSANVVRLFEERARPLGWPRQARRHSTSTARRWRTRPAATLFPGHRPSLRAAEQPVVRELVEERGAGTSRREARLRMTPSPRARRMILDETAPPTEDLIPAMARALRISEPAR